MNQLQSESNLSSVNNFFEEKKSLFIYYYLFLKRAT